MKKAIAILVSVAMLFRLCSCGESGTQYVALLSGGEVVAEFSVMESPSLSIYGARFKLPDGHEICWNGDYLLTDVPVDAPKPVISIQGG